MDFLSHDSGVRWFFGKATLAVKPIQAAIRPRLGYPSLGCFPAAPNSVSLSNDEYTKRWSEAHKYTAARFPVMDSVAKHRPAGVPQPCN